MCDASCVSSSVESGVVDSGRATSILGRAGVLMAGDGVLFVFARSSWAVTGVSVTSSTCRGTGSDDCGDDGNDSEDVEDLVALDCFRPGATVSFISPSSLEVTGYVSGFSGENSCTWRPMVSATTGGETYRLAPRQANVTAAAVRVTVVLRGMLRFSS